MNYHWQQVWAATAPSRRKSWLRQGASIRTPISERKNGPSQLAIIVSHAAYWQKPESYGPIYTRLSTMWEPLISLQYNSRCSSIFSHTRTNWKEIVIPILDRTSHRVDRVLGFFFSRPNWDSLSRRRVCPPPSPLWFPIPTRGQSLWYSRYILYVLCGSSGIKMQKRF
jgi:hypothetical protein